LLIGPNLGDNFSHNLKFAFRKSKIFSPICRDFNGLFSGSLCRTMFVRLQAPSQSHRGEYFASVRQSKVRKIAVHIFYQIQSPSKKIQKIPLACLGLLQGLLQLKLPKNHWVNRLWIDIQQRYFANLLAFAGHFAKSPWKHVGETSPHHTHESRREKPCFLVPVFGIKY